jgi:hypothetical protein
MPVRRFVATPVPGATAHGSVFVWRCISLPLKTWPPKPRKQKVWGRGSTNTEPGAVATGFLSETLSIVGRPNTEPGAVATGSFPRRSTMTIKNLGNEAMSVEPGRSVLTCIWDVDLSEPWEPAGLRCLCLGADACTEVRSQRSTRSLRLPVLYLCDAVPIR